MIGGVVRRVTRPVLVGREGELAQLGAVLQRAASGQPAIVVVIAELCRAGLAVEAAIAEHARARRAADDERAARELAAGLIERVRAATSAREVVTTPVVGANTRTAEAEWSRVTGPSDPERWAASARAWEAVGFPWPAAYARWRQAEALLTGGAPRPEAAEVLATAWNLAQGLGAKLLAVELDALARRARVELRSPSGEAAPVAHRLRLTG
jgi:hypothetical protein